MQEFLITPLETALNTTDSFELFLFFFFPGEKVLEEEGDPVGSQLEKVTYCCPHCIDEETEAQR